MRLTLEQPKNRDLEAICGYDRALGFFCEVRRGGRIVEEYDLLTCHPNTLQGLLDLLIDHGFLKRPDLEEALTLLMTIRNPSEIRDETVRQAALLVYRLKEAAGE